MIQIINVNVNDKEKIIATSEAVSKGDCLDHALSAEIRI